MWKIKCFHFLYLFANLFNVDVNLKSWLVLDIGILQQTITRKQNLFYGIFVMTNCKEVVKNLSRWEWFETDFQRKKNLTPQARNLVSETKNQAPRTLNDFP